MMTAEPIKRPGFTFTAIDFETANWYRSSACSIGMVRVKDGIIVDRYYSLLKPEPNFFNEINVRIHGITAEQCENAPRFVDLLPEIRHWIDGEVLVAHNASFEKSVIKKLAQKQDFDLDPSSFLCSLYASRIEFPKLASHKLSRVYYEIFKSGLNHHYALDDAEACAKIILSILGDWDPPTFRGCVDALYLKPLKDQKPAKLKLKDIVIEDGFEGVESLKGHTFCFTGELISFVRHEAWQYVVNHGGFVSNSITKNTTHLVVGHNGIGTSKYMKALDRNTSGVSIRFMNEEEFLKMAKI